MAININGTGSITGLSSLSSPTISGGSLPAGSASTPGITFSGDTNTGIYSPGADQVAISTNGTGRLFVGSSGNVGVGNSSPSQILSIGGSTGRIFTVNQGTANKTILDNDYALELRSNGGYQLIHNANNSIGSIAFQINSSERARIDSSGRLLVGASNTFNTGSTLQVRNDSNNATVEIFNSSADVLAPALRFTKTRGSVGSPAEVQDGDQLGYLIFMGYDGSGYPEAAYIGCEADSDWTTSGDTTDNPTRLVFLTTANGESSPAQRMRIDSNGQVLQTTPISTDCIKAINTNASFINTVFFAVANRAASSAYYLFAGASNAGSDNEFLLRGDGNGLCDGASTGGGADYAEYFEWSDNNPDEEDRRGISVVLDGEKIRPAIAGEDPIGVISGNPSVVGDAAWNKWSSKYLRDDYGTYIQEDYEVEDEDGNTVIQQRRKLNPAYDPDVEYISREERPEWDCVGLMGKLRLRKGQPTGSRWIKMRDISDSVEEWLVR